MKRLPRIVRLAFVMLLAACAAPLTVAEERDAGGPGPSFSPVVPGDAGVEASGDGEVLSDPPGDGSTDDG